MLKSLNRKIGYSPLKVAWLIEAGLLVAFIAPALLTILRPMAVRR